LPSSFRAFELVFTLIEFGHFQKSIYFLDTTYVGKRCNAISKQYKT
jgi:hypothetical protein